VTKDRVRAKCNNCFLMNTKEAAEYLGLSAYTLRNWRQLSRGPRWVAVGRLPKYRPVDLDCFIEENIVHV